MKRARPFAAGQLKVQHGLIVGVALIGGGLAGAVMLSPPFALGLAAYLVVTLAYSFGLKRVAFLDVFVLASLYTLRLLMGTLLIGSFISQWLMTFSMMFFFALSLAKRHVEVAAAPPGEIRGRGYRASDAPLTLAFGIAATMGSILILVTYLMEDAFPSGLYKSSYWLWFAPALIALWTMRIWLLAHRGELHDDPVAFAVRDTPSLLLGVFMVITFFFAVFI